CRNHPRTFSAGQAPSDEPHENIYHSFEAGSITGVPISTSKHLMYNTNTPAEKKTAWTTQPETVDDTVCLESSLSTPRGDISRHVSPEAISILEKLSPVKVISSPEAGPSIPQIFHQKESMEASIEIVIEKTASCYQRYGSKGLLKQALASSDSAPVVTKKSSPHLWLPPQDHPGRNPWMQLGLQFQGENAGRHTKTGSQNNFLRKHVRDETSG
ncbi:hypothetical protein C5167_035508, partial [Papaver somniferum]